MEVHLRGGFSDRNGILKENDQMQIDNFDERTRVTLINATSSVIDHVKAVSNVYKFDKFLKSLLAEVYLMEVDWSSPCDLRTVIPVICDTIRTDSFNSVLTLIEFLENTISENFKIPVAPFYNHVFEKEYVGYRFVDGQIAPITNETEISAINEASSSQYKEINDHLEKAIRLLSDRNSPDYKNSIKESISAVERMCSIIIGKSATLGDALKKLESSGLTIHPAMKAAFEKLFGYTSDSSGIRHAGQLGGADSTFEEAKFMLVSCSAFVNYLIGVSAKN